MAILRRKKKSRHSPAGQRHIKSMALKGYRFTRTGQFVKTMAAKGVEARLRRASPELVRDKEIKKTGLSRQTKKQLQGLSKRDYAEVMKALKRKR